MVAKIEWRSKYCHYIMASCTIFRFTKKNVRVTKVIGSKTLLLLSKEKQPFLFMKQKTFVSQIPLLDAIAFYNF